MHLASFTGEGEKGRTKQEESQLDAVSAATIGAAIAVHSELGPGHLESVYAQALCLEFDAQSIPFRREVETDISYRGRIVGTGRLDFIVHEVLVIELKSVADLLPVHSAQLISYLKMTGFPRGLLMNFNVARLKYGIRKIVHPDLHSNLPFSPSPVKEFEK